MVSLASLATFLMLWFITFLSRRYWHGMTVWLTVDVNCTGYMATTFFGTGPFVHYFLFEV